MKKETVCAFCLEKVFKEASSINRAKKQNKPIFCNAICFGLSKRVSKEQKVKTIAIYHKIYREKNKKEIKEKKSIYYKKTYNPEKAAIERKKNMPKHVLYMQQPKWVEYKKEYDKVYLAKKKYGEYWECNILINEIEKLYDDKEIRQINNLHNKSQKRKRQWKQIKN